MNGFDMFTFGAVFIILVIIVSAIYSAICALANRHSQKEQYIKYGQFDSSSDDLKDEHIKLTNSIKNHEETVK